MSCLWCAQTYCNYLTTFLIQLVNTKIISMVTFLLWNDNLSRYLPQQQFLIALSIPNSSFPDVPFLGSVTRTPAQCRCVTGMFPHTLGCFQRTQPLPQAHSAAVRRECSGNCEQLRGQSGKYEVLLKLPFLLSLSFLIDSSS